MSKKKKVTKIPKNPKVSVKDAKEQLIIAKEEMKKEIPDEVKVVFGKFYVFSFVYILFFLLLLPYVLDRFFHKVSLGLLIFWLVAFYIYMIIDVRKKRNNFTSSIFVFLIFLVFSSILFSIIKVFF